MARGSRRSQTMGQGLLPFAMRLVVPAFACLAAPQVLFPAALAQTGQLSASVRNEYASFIYASSEAQGSLVRQANAELLRLRDDIARRDDQIAAQRRRIVSLSGQTKALSEAKAELDRLLGEATREKEDLVRQLADKDRDFAREREVLIDTANSLLETPEGIEALRLFNQRGRENYLAAQAILDRKIRVETAARRRTPAILASQALERGDETMAGAIARWEAVVNEAARVSDLATLGDLYARAGRLADLAGLVPRMEALARDDGERMRAALMRADFAKARGDGTARRAALEAAISHGEAHLAGSNDTAAPFMLALARYAFVLEAGGTLDATTARRQIDLALPVFEAAVAANPGNELLEKEVVRGQLLSLTVRLIEQGRTIEGARALTAKGYDPAPVQAVLARARKLTAANPENHHLGGFVNGLICGTSGILLDFAPQAAALMVDECLAGTRRFAGRDSANLAVQMSLVEALASKAKVEAARGDWRAAAVAVEEALGLARKVAAASPDLRDARAAEAQLLVYKGETAANLGRRAEVLPLLDGAVTAFEVLVTADPADAQARRNLVDACWKAGDQASVLSGMQGATPYLLKGLPHARTLARRSDAWWPDQLMLAAYLVTMSRFDIGGVTPAEALRELDAMDRNGAVVPEGRAQFEQLRTTLRGLLQGGGAP